jgi:hypothetical protein
MKKLVKPVLMTVSALFLVGCSSVNVFKDDLTVAKEVCESNEGIQYIKTKSFIHSNSFFVICQNEVTFKIRVNQYFTERSQEILDKKEK